MTDNPRHIVSFSGGKDSTAMLLRMLETGRQIDEIVFADTGMEFPEMRPYIEKIEKYIHQDITVVKGKRTWDEWFYGKITKGKLEGRTRGFPYKSLGCWAARDLKIRPIEAFHKKEDISYIGIAYDEKHRAEREYYKKRQYRFPLIDWKRSEQDCYSYLQKKNLLNPLYLKFKRLGCWCCPKQNKQSLQTLYLEYPDYWARLKRYERDSPHGFRTGKSLQELEMEFKRKTSIKNPLCCQRTLQT